MEALAGRDRSQTAPQMLTAPGERRIVGGGKVEAHHLEQGVQEPFGLAQREMVEKPQGQGGLDGEIRVPPLPTSPAAPAGRPGSDRVRGHRHIAASNKGPIVGRPVRNAVLRLIRGMDLRLHPCSVAPAEDHEKCGPNHRTRAGSSCNNAPATRRRARPGRARNRAAWRGRLPAPPRWVAISLTSGLASGPAAAIVFSARTAWLRLLPTAAGRGGGRRGSLRPARPRSGAAALMEPRE